MANRLGGATTTGTGTGLTPAQENTLTNVAANDPLQDGRLTALETSQTAQDTSLAAKADDAALTAEIAATDAEQVTQDARIQALEDAPAAGPDPTKADQTALQAEIDSTDAEQTAQDGRLTALETDQHTHPNKTLLDAVTGHGTIVIVDNKLTYTDTKGDPVEVDLPVSNTLEDTTDGQVLEWMHEYVLHPGFKYTFPTVTEDFGTNWLIGLPSNQNWQSGFVPETDWTSAGAQTLGVTQLDQITATAGELRFIGETGTPNNIKVFVNSGINTALVDADDSGAPIDTTKELTPDDTVLVRVPVVGDFVTGGPNPVPLKANSLVNLRPLTIIAANTISDPFIPANAPLFEFVGQATENNSALYPGNNGAITLRRDNYYFSNETIPAAPAAAEGEWYRQGIISATSAAHTVGDGAQITITTFVAVEDKLNPGVWEWMDEQAAQSPTDANRELTDGDEIPANQFTVTKVDSLVMPQNPKTTDWVAVYNANFIDTGKRIYITGGDLTLSENGITIPAGTVAPGMMLYAFYNGTEWEIPLPNSAVMAVDDSHNGLEMREDIVYEFLSTQAGNKLILPNEAVGIIQVRLNPLSTFPITIEQKVPADPEQIRLEDASMIKSLEIPVNHARELVRLETDVADNIWRAYRPWKIADIHNNAQPWAPDTDYFVGDVVTQYRLSDGALYSYVWDNGDVDGTSGTVWDPTEEGRWIEVGAVTTVTSVYINHTTGNNTNDGKTAGEPWADFDNLQEGVNYKIHLMSVGPFPAVKFENQNISILAGVPSGFGVQPQIGKITAINSNLNLNGDLANDSNQTLSIESITAENNSNVLLGNATVLTPLTAGTDALRIGRGSSCYINYNLTITGQANRVMLAFGNSQISVRKTVVVAFTGTALNYLVQSATGSVVDLGTTMPTTAVDPTVNHLNVRDGAVIKRVETTAKLADEFTNTSATTGGTFQGWFSSVALKEFDSAETNYGSDAGKIRFTLGLDGKIYKANAASIPAGTEPTTNDGLLWIASQKTNVYGDYRSSATQIHTYSSLATVDTIRFSLADLNYETRQSTVQELSPTILTNGGLGWVQVNGGAADGDGFTSIEKTFELANSRFYRVVVSARSNVDDPTSFDWKVEDQYSYNADVANNVRSNNRLTVLDFEINRIADGDRIQFGTTTDKAALGVVTFGTPFFDINLGKLQKYTAAADSFAVTKAATALPTMIGWNATSGFSASNFKIATSVSDAVDNPTVTLPDGVETLLYVIGEFIDSTTGVPTGQVVGGGFTVLNTGGVVSLVSVEPDRHYTAMDWATATYQDLTTSVAQTIVIDDADVKAIFDGSANAGVWEDTSSDATEDQGSALVGGEAVEVDKLVNFTIPDVAGPWLDSTGKEFDQNTFQVAKVATGFTPPADLTTLTPAQFANLTVSTGEAAGTVYGTVASQEIGTLKMVPDVKEDGTVKAPADYVAEGLFPVISGYRLTDGAVNNPKFALMYPTLVADNDLVWPQNLDGVFIRNLGGNASSILNFQTDATAVKGLRTLRTYVQSDWNGQSNNDFGKGSGSLTGSRNDSGGLSSSDPETRPRNFAMQFGLVLDSYAKQLMVDPELVPVDDTGADDGDGVAFRDDGAGGFKLAKSDVKLYGIVASQEIGTLKMVPNLHEDGSAKVSADYVTEGLLPLINGYRLTDGATDNPVFALMLPAFVSGNDLLVPTTFDGDFVRNLGGNAGAFMANQNQATARNGLRLNISTTGGTVLANAGAILDHGGSQWHNAGDGVNLTNHGAITGDTETRPDNFAMQFCLTLDTYAKQMMIDPALVPLDATGVADGDNVVFKDDGAGGFTLAKGPAAAGGAPTEQGTPHKTGSTREYVLQWNGTEMVSQLAKEVWTTGTRGSTSYRRYMIDHLTQTAHIIGAQSITSSGTVSWPELAFADADAYVFAHDLREAQAETASLRINSRTTTSLNYTLHDSVGTGDAGSVVKFMISGEL